MQVVIWACEQHPGTKKKKKAMHLDALLEGLKIYVHLKIKYLGLMEEMSQTTENSSLLLWFADCVSSQQNEWPANAYICSIYVKLLHCILAQQ